MTTLQGLRRHKLLTAEGRKALPPLYTNEALEDPRDAVAHVKLFSPYSQHRWYLTEFDGEDLFFGLTVGHETEWGYLSLRELEGAALMGGRLPAVERDLHFEPKTVREAYRDDYGRDL